VSSEPRPYEMSGERKRDCVVRRIALYLPKTMMTTVDVPIGEEPAFASGAVAGDSTEVKAGALECLEGSRIQKWQ
jgi:hypothetical protein